MFVVDYLAIESFSLVLASSGYFLVNVSFDVEVVVVGVFFIVMFKIEQELLDVGTPLL